ncbi:MAG: hypothetical protein C4527_13910 [Candidatus Omnitrophota bacterium]|jgi:hypothetical protein|nr:MAG: hypothetical protein C4527_13910 [Candidatus Omnitrophota bacterium]
MVLESDFMLGKLIQPDKVATRLGGSDFEDNLQIACAMTAQLDVIVTRDPSGFAASSIPVLTSQQMLLRLSGGNEC